MLEGRGLNKRHQEKSLFKQPHFNIHGCILTPFFFMSFRPGQIPAHAVTNGDFSFILIAQPTDSCLAGGLVGC